MVGNGGNRRWRKVGDKMFDEESGGNSSKHFRLIAIFYGAVDWEGGGEKNVMVRVSGCYKPGSCHTFGCGASITDNV